MTIIKACAIGGLIGSPLNILFRKFVMGRPLTPLYFIGLIISMLVLIVITVKHKSVADMIGI